MILENEVGLPMSDEKIILNNIKYRRSVFPPSYTTQPIAEEVILELVTAANCAPTHKFTQPWRFTIFKGNGLMALAHQMASLYKSHTPAEQFLPKKHAAIQEKITRSAVVIAIRIKYSGLVPKWEEVAAVGCAVQNLWLAAHAKGIGGYWSTPDIAGHLNEFLNLEKEEECLGLFYLGYHHESPAVGKRTPISEKIDWVLD